MQLPKKILTLCMAVAITISACKKNNVDTPNTPDTPEIPVNESTVKGKVVLPVGNAVDVNTFSVLSNTDDIKVTDGAYSVDVSGNYTSLYVTNPSGQVVLMGYKYPGSTNNDISPESSAMGMVMMSPALLSLTEEAKITIINKLKTDNNFNGLVAEINKGFNAGRPLFDTTNTAMIAAFDKLFQTAAARVGTTPKELPVNMYSSGKNFTFQNSAKTYTTVIGVYKGNNFVENIVIDGKTFFSTSITDLLSGKAFLLGDPDNQLYKLDGDGDFTFKFRTGKPGFGDGSPQHDDAFYKNLAQFSIGLLSILSPEYISCFGAFRGRLYESIKNLVELNSNSNMSPANVLEIVWNFSVGSMKDLIKNCTNNSPSPKWLMWLDKFTSSLNLYSKTVSGANTTLFGIQWANSEAVIDTCFKANGSTVTPGGCDKACIDSTAIYEAACMGSWTVTNVESGDNQNLVLYENGGRYIVDGPDGLGRDGIDENGNSYYNISWRIEKRNCKYFLREDGYWHFAFEQSRSLDISLNNVYLTYPVSSFTTYNQFSGAPYPSRIYTKN